MVKEALKIEQVEIPCGCVNVTFNEVEVDSGDQLSSYKTSSKKPLLLFPDGNVIRSLVIDTCLAACFSCCEEVIALTILQGSIQKYLIERSRATGGGGRSYFV